MRSLNLSHLQASATKSLDLASYIIFKIIHAEYRVICFRPWKPFKGFCFRLSDPVWKKTILPTLIGVCASCFTTIIIWHTIPTPHLSLFHAEYWVIFFSGSLSRVFAFVFQTTTILPTLIGVCASCFTTIQFQHLIIRGCFRLRIQPRRLHHEATSDQFIHITNFRHHPCTRPAGKSVLTNTNKKNSIEYVQETGQHIKAWLRSKLWLQVSNLKAACISAQSIAYFFIRSSVICSLAEPHELFCAEIAHQFTTSLSLINKIKIISAS